MKTPKDLSRDELEAIVETAQRAFWLNGLDDWDTDTQWSWERVEDIAGVMVYFGLRPTTVVESDDANQN
jgi:hypothetical protein